MAQVTVRANQNALGLTAGEQVTVELTDVIQAHLDSGVLSLVESSEPPVDLVKP